MLDLNAIRQKLLRGYSHSGAYDERMDEMQQAIAALIADDEQVRQQYLNAVQKRGEEMDANFALRLEIMRLKRTYEADVQEIG